jgi:ketosteroid isomerase-like protein
LNKDQAPKTSRAASGAGASSRPQSTESEELLPGEMRRHKPPKEAVEAAFQRFQTIAAEVDAAEHQAESRPGTEGDSCPSCGHKNRPGNRFCAMCGSTLTPGAPQAVAHASEPNVPQPPPDPQESAPREPVASGPHHHHHHYHYHYFPGGVEGGRRFVPGPRDSEKAAVLPPASKSEPHHSRAETAVRRLTQDWVIACNTRHLEDVLELYGADGIVYRSNQPSVRASAALREFFVTALDAGLGEVTMEAARVEIAGDMAYEVGKFSALVPGAGGKRREERGKYVRVLAKDAEGDWKISVDCWSSDLTLAAEEPARPAPAPARRP